MKQLLFFSGNLALELFVANENFLDESHIRCKNLCIIFPGIPNAFSKEFFATRVQDGAAYLYVHYLGTWLSGSISSPDNCRKSVSVALNFARAGRSNDLWKNKQVEWSFDRIYIVGYSFAGNILLTSDALHDVSGVSLYSPLIFIHDEDIKKITTESEFLGFHEINKAKIEFLIRGYKNAWRGIDSNEWKQYFMGKDDKSNMKHFKSASPLTIYHGTQDKQVDCKFSKYFGEHYGASVQLILNASHSKDLIDTKNMIG